MNPQIPIEVRQTVLDYVTAGTSFTAYEVTLEVRRRLGTSIDVPHGAVNSLVQQMFANGEIIGYDRREDQAVQAATKPFRYYQRGGGVAAPFVRPTAPAISRSNLPAPLRFSGDIRRALLRNYALAAREFQVAGGKADGPFALYIPSFKDLVFRVRCYGAGWDNAQVERKFTLDANANTADLRWLSALAYADEFRVYSNRNGTQTQFRVALDPTIVGTVTREAARATGEPDGLEIEIPSKTRDVSGFPALAFDLFRHFAVPPRLYQDGKLLTPNAATALLEGESWFLTAATAPLILVDEVPYPSYYSPQLIGSGFRLKLSANDLDLEPNAENLANTPRTRAAIEGAAAVVENEFLEALNTRLESAPDLLEAKRIYGQINKHLGAPETYTGVAAAYAGDDDEDEPTHIAERVSEGAQWRGILVDSDYFRWPDDLLVEVRRYAPSSGKTKVNMRRVRTIQIGGNRPIFLDDVGDKTISRRMDALYQSAPFEAAYVISFEGDAARAAFFRATNFDSVPTRPLSQLPVPAAPPRAVTTSNRTPFDAQLHQIKAPASGVAAAFAVGDGGSDDDFENLKQWARTTQLDEKNWPDFKRTYKAIEARLWPPLGRFRWDKSEADFAATPIPSERDLELLGVLMGRLDGISVSRGAVKPVAAQPTIAQRALGALNNLVGRAGAATPGGPSDNTLSYMKRRATKLLIFLRDNATLSDERRDALAPIVGGLLQRERCADINATLPLRLKLTETEILARHPEVLARVWADATLPMEIARWSYNWLESQGQIIAVAPAQLRRFVEIGDVDWTLKLAPAALQNDQIWPSDFGLRDFSRYLQGNLQKTGGDGWENSRINSLFLQRRGDVLNLFVRFPQLECDKRWLRDSLSEVSDETTLDWLAPWLGERARNGEFMLIEKMSAPLQSRFNAAIVAAFPQGLSLQLWRGLINAPALLIALAPALRQLPLQSAVADFIWALPPAQRDPILSALADNPALLPIIEDHARRLDFAFIAPLSPLQWEHFARVVGQNFPDGIGADAWGQIAQLPFDSGYNELPLGAGFWQFVLPLEAETRAQWIARVGAARACREFAGQNADVFEQLLDCDATGLGELGDAWLAAHLSSIALDGELILKLAQSNVSDWQARALARLSNAELRLPVALRLMESELPILERAATPFFRDQSADWSERVLALADSPKFAARELALQLLEEFRARWTPELLRQLAQHDDAGVQAFVAAQLKSAPANVVESKAIESFNNAIINARGRARRAKESVKTRVDAGEFDRETLLEAARNGAARDREWALQQLVTASLSGAEVDGLEVKGAFAKAESR